MKPPRTSVIGLGIGLAATAIALAQGRGGEGGPQQHVRHEGFIWKAWATEERPTLFVAGILKSGGGPGQHAYLEPASPQGINPRILILEVKFADVPGAWPEPLVDLPVVYQRPGYRGEYDSVTVRMPGGGEIHLVVNVAGGRARDGAGGGSEDAERIALRTVYLQRPIQEFRRIAVEGDLGGEGRLLLDRNTCTVTEFGDSTGCTRIAIDSRMVTFQPVRTEEGRRLFLIRGAGLNDPLYLVAPSTPRGPYRLVSGERGPDGPAPYPISLERGED